MSIMQLDELKKFTKIVVDTGDIESIEQYQPQDATTNPSLILKAAQMANYKYLIIDAIKWAKKNSNKNSDFLSAILLKLFVNFGLKILNVISGRVSIEVDAAFSFDIDKSVKMARDYITLYKESGIDKERVLIKLASTWEGIEAAKILEKEGIHCNMTLVFSLAQAIAAAEANVTLISPFVGRIYDWQLKKDGVKYISPDKDMGVISVTNIYNYYKKFDYKTQVMGASFRNVGEIIALAGCDLLTISPQLLQELNSSLGKIERKLDPSKSKKLNIDKIIIDEKNYRYLLCSDEMATEKLFDGIRNFVKDTIELKNYISQSFL